MKIIIEETNGEDEDEIIVRCRQLDEQLLQLIYNMRMKDEKIAGMYMNKIYLINPREIYYFEAVDNKVFIYGKDQVYESKQKLYEIETKFENTDFFRASKSVILNVAKIKNITPAFNGRFEALLFNGEKVIISRQYVSVLKQKLGL